MVRPLRFLDQFHDALKRGEAWVVSWVKSHGDAEAFLAKQDEKSRGPGGVLKPGPPAPDYDVGDHAYGAPPEKRDREVQRLRAMYNDADLRWIISYLQERLEPPPRSRRTERIDWSSPVARKAKLEIVALHSAYGLTQIAACERWLEYRQKADPHGDYLDLAWVDAQTLRKAVFDR